MIHHPTSPDTIFALSSAPGRAGVSVFRISGAETAKVLRGLAGTLPRPRRATLATLCHAGAPIDRALVLWMPGPGNFTGEDVAELHVHGSPAVVEAVATALHVLGPRQAAPGEFTRRAFLNGRMDLTEAEGLADLIDADTQGQRAQALRQMSGGLRETYGNWRERILDALATVEGEIDFPDEADVPNKLSRAAGPILDVLAKDLQSALDDFGRGERVRTGLSLAVIGAPNAGKSSLLNWLAGRDAAIVSDVAGTTRDVVEVGLEVAGLPVTVADTAGLRESSDGIEAEGIRRARARAETADMRILVVDASAPSPEGEGLLQPGDVVLFNKSDLSDPPTDPPDVSRETFSVSVRTGDGLDPVMAHLENTIRDRYAPARDPGLTRARHRNCVVRALDALRRARVQLDAAPELAGDDLRAALLAIAELAGEADMDAVLDRVFSRFCIGK